MLENPGRSRGWTSLEPQANYRSEAKARLAAAGAAGLLCSVAAYQAALAAGAPLGDTVYGGRAPTTDGVLGPAHRLASAGAAATLGFSAWMVAARGGLVRTRPIGDRFVRNGTWVLAGLLAANTAANMAARHPFERWVLGSVTATSSALCFVVARSDGEGGIAEAGRPTGSRTNW